ncbi:MAG TPA: LysR family transcriptional regulator [bacterium]|nr:LysR family transcriptional regulator [bacterium]
MTVGEFVAINIHLLKIFHAVARSGSFSRAASELAISQPSVSIQVGELERQFGVELFEPAGKSVRLTEAGRVCFDYAGRILALLDEAQRAMDEVKGLRRGRLLVGATQTPGTYILPGLLGRLKAEYPRLEVTLRIGEPRRIQEMVLRHELDVAVTGWRIALPDLEAVPIARDELVLVTAPSHRFTDLPDVAVADLSGEPFIMRERGSGSRELVDDALHRAGIYITPTLELEGVDAVKQAVAANLGISMLSRHAIDLEVESGRLRIVPVRGFKVERSIWLVRHRDRQLSRAAQAFVALVTAPAPPVAEVSPAAAPEGR